MAVNRFMQPAQAEFMNTYVPIPFDQMMKMGMMKQQMVEQNDQLTDETLGSLNNIKVAPADEPAYLEKTNKIKSEINDIISTATPGSYEAKRRLMSLRNKLSTDPELRDMTQNYAVYSDAMTQKQDAEKEGAISANTLDLNNTITDLSSGGKGTLGRRKETGSSGVYNRGSWMKTVDVNKAMEARINDVPESSFEQAGLTIKDGNKYIIEAGSAGKSLNALGAPLGIAFTTNEKGEQSIDLSRSNIDIFLATPEGKQIQNIARERVQNGQAEDYGKEVQRQYYSHALAAINERVSSKSTVRLAADPFDQARYKKELDDKVNPWSTPLSIATSASKLSSFNRTEEARNTIDNQIVTAQQNLQQFKDLYGVKEVTATTPDGQSYTVYKDKNNVDVSEAYDLKQAEIKQLQDQKQSISDMVARVKGELDIPQTWEPDKRIKEDAEDKRRNVEDRFLYEANSASHAPATPKQIATAKELGQDAYDKYIQDKDPTWSKLNNALKTNAAKSSVITSTTKFGSKELNERALAEFPLLMENEVQDVGTKTSLDVKQKEALGILSGGKAAVNDPSKVIFGGSLVDPESQKIKFVYQTYDKKGKLSDPFMVDAPSGVVDDLIRTGATSQAKVMIHQQLSRLYTNSDNTTSITLGTGEHTKATVRRTSPSGEGLKPKFLLTVNLADGPKEKVFDDPTALIDYYEAYVITDMQKRK